MHGNEVFQRLRNAQIGAKQYPVVHQHQSGADRLPKRDADQDER
jgi:hypothetical protein